MDMNRPPKVKRPHPQKVLRIPTKRHRMNTTVSFTHSQAAGFAGFLDRIDHLGSPGCRQARLEFKERLEARMADLSGEEKVDISPEEHEVAAIFEGFQNAVAVNTEGEVFHYNRILEAASAFGVKDPLVDWVKERFPVPGLPA